MKAGTEKAIRDHAEGAYPNEACGLIVVIKGKEQYRPCRNVATDPRKDFVVHDADQREAEDLGDILALVHSHPGASADMSVADRVQCANNGIPWVIVSVLNGVSDVIKEYKPDGYVAPLVGRPFVHGVLDCYALVRDYYARELKIELPDFKREDGWWDRGEDLYMDNLAATGFEPIKGDIKVGDLIVMQVRAPKANHGAVYIGESTMLHHMYGRLSTREIYGGYYQEITRVIVRHRSML